MIDVQHSQNSLNLTNKVLNAKLSNIETFSLSYTQEEIERMKLCGILFDRKSSVRKEYIDEFFRKEPCLYDQATYKYAARIFHCLKVDLNENPILKSLKQEQLEMNNEQQEKITEVPRINYKNNQEKKNTFKLAFSVLRFQKLLEQLFEDCQFYVKYPESKDEQSLACTILFDYMMRKFQLRELTEEELLDKDKLVSLIESYIYQEKTHLAAALARNRIKSDALTVEELLPIELREVEHHKAELPLYCWINSLKIDIDTVVQHFINEEKLELVGGKDSLNHKCFMIDPHCANVLSFHYALREKILNHEFVKDYKLIIQDKSSCLAPITVQKLLYKNDDVILTDVGGGLVAAYLGCIMKELEGRVFVFGATSDEKYEEITHKMKLIGCSKYVKVMREKFPDEKSSEKLDEKIVEKLLNVKVILVNAPCSKSALMNPMDFLFQEGADVRLLRDFSIDYKNEKRLLNSIEKEKRLLNYALSFPYVRAIVYQTYSKNREENDDIIHKSLQQFNSSKKSNLFPYKLAPPVIPITMTDLQNDEIVKGVKFLQFKPSNKMNGCFVALISRDKDAKVDKELKKEYALKVKRARELALAAAAAEEAAERGEPIPEPVEDETTQKKEPKKSVKKRSPSLKKLPPINNQPKKPTIEEQIKKLESNQAVKSQENFGKTPMTYVESLNSIEGKLAQIGKLKLETRTTSEEEKSAFFMQQQPIQMKSYEFNVKKSVEDNLNNDDDSLIEETLSGNLISTENGLDENLILNKSEEMDEDKKSSASNSVTDLSGEAPLGESNLLSVTVKSKNVKTIEEQNKQDEKRTVLELKEFKNELDDSKLRVDKSSVSINYTDINKIFDKTEVDRENVNLNKSTSDMNEPYMSLLNLKSEELKNNFIETQTNIRELNDMKLQYEKFTVNLNKEQLKDAYTDSSDSESNEDIKSKHCTDTTENDKIKALCLQMENIEDLKYKIEESNVENFNLELKIELKLRSDKSPSLINLQTDMNESKSNSFYGSNNSNEIRNDSGETIKISKEKLQSKTDKFDGYTVNYLKDFKFDSIIQPKKNELKDPKEFNDLSLNKNSDRFATSTTCNFEENYENIKKTLTESERNVESNIEDSNLNKINSKKTSVESIYIEDDDIISDWKTRTSLNNLNPVNESKSSLSNTKQNDMNISNNKVISSPGDPNKSEIVVENLKGTKYVRFNIDNSENSQYNSRKSRSSSEFYSKQNKISSSEPDFWKVELNEIETRLRHGKPFKHDIISKVSFDTKIQIPTKNFRPKFQASKPSTNTEETVNRLYKIPKKEFRHEISEKVFEIESSYDNRLPITIQSLQPTRRSYKPRINEILFNDETFYWNNQEDSEYEPNQVVNKSLKQRIRVFENEATSTGEEDKFLMNIKFSQGNFHRERNDSAINEKINFVKKNPINSIMSQKINNTNIINQSLTNRRKPYPLSEIKLDFTQLTKPLIKNPKMRPSSVSPPRNQIQSKLLPKRQKEQNFSHLSLYLEAKKLL